MHQPLRVALRARVLVLTGAGISAESGIRTFRDADGLWKQYRFEEDLFVNPGEDFTPEPETAPRAKAATDARSL